LWGGKRPCQKRGKKGRFERHVSTLKTFIGKRKTDNNANTALRGRKGGENTKLMKGGGIVTFVIEGGIHSPAKTAGKKNAAIFPSGAYRKGKRKDSIVQGGGGKGGKTVI